MINFRDIPFHSHVQTNKKKKKKESHAAAEEDTAIRIGLLMGEGRERGSRFVRTASPAAG
jgi:hypothetical protein